MRIGTRLLAALTLTAGLNAAGFAQTPRLEDLLARKPVQPVTVSTPTAAELPACRVEPGNYPTPFKGTVVRDAQGRLLRQFIDSKGRGTTDLVYFYHEGVEAYREIDGNADGKPDQFRWLGVNGGKWGADADQDGTVDAWYVLSPQELSQEVFAALQSRDMRRIEALTLTPKDAQTLGLPAADAEALVRRSAAAVARAKATAEALALTDKSRWIHVELGLPSAVAADTFGGRDDLVKQPSALVLYDKGDGKADLFTVGEMVQVGKYWRLLDGPVPGAQPALPAGASSGNVAVLPPDAQPLLAKLQAVKPAAGPSDLRRFHLERATILEQIVAMTKGNDQQPWLKQVVDSYAVAAEADPTQGGAALARLKEWAAIIAKDAPGTSAAAYAAFRTAGAEYTARMATAKEGQVGEVQKWWRTKLEEFVAAHPTADDAPEAMMRLAVSHEFAGRDGEAAAKQWYEKLAATHGSHPSAAKAQGAIRRLTSEGQPFALPPARTLDGKPYEFAATGKPTLVVYYLNWGGGQGAEDRVVADLKNYADLAKVMGDKLSVVSVSLDEDPARAQAAVTAAGLPGTHLHLPGGLDRSPLAVAYGIQTVPYVFLLDKAGKVSEKNAQYGPALRDAVERLAK
jgi:hypothetical protein